MDNPLEKIKYSRSHFEVERQLFGGAIVKIRIFTGRTHQIRVHMKALGHPVIGDEMYNNHKNRFPDETLMLHSYSLSIKHPVTDERMEFVAPIPKRFDDLVTKLLKESGQ